MNVRKTWTSVAQLHESERLIALATTWWGRIAIWVAAALLLLPFAHGWIVLPAIVLATILPVRRRLVLSVCGVFVLADFLWRRGGGEWPETLETKGWLLLGAAAVLVLLSYLVFLAARHYQSLPGPVRRHPFLWLHLCFWSFVAVLWKTSGAAGASPKLLLLVWAFLPYFLWRASYLLLSGRRGKVAGTSFADHFFTFWPAFGGTDVPYGKGWDYLRRHETADALALARAQLAGIKLYVLACLWKAVPHVTQGVVYGYRDDTLRGLLGGFSLRARDLGMLISGEAAVSTPKAWLVLYLELFHVVLALAVLGHVIVGSLRLMGFNVFRNTYKPLLAESIVDFWNRFYYYFKELLVELWFYPTYLACSRKRPRLRLFAAVFMAAFVGNLTYHVLRDRNLVAAADVFTLWELHGPRSVYCALLTLGIFVSMLRQEALRGSSVPPTLLVRLRRILGVWTFFALIHVFSTPAPRVGIAGRFRFLLGLVGLGEPVAHP